MKVAVKFAMELDLQYSNTKATILFPITYHILIYRKYIYLSHHSATHSSGFLVLTVYHLTEHAVPEVSVQYHSECLSQKAVNETLEKKGKGNRKQQTYQV